MNYSDFYSLKIFENNFNGIAEKHLNKPIKPISLICENQNDNVFYLIFACILTN